MTQRRWVILAALCAFAAVGTAASGRSSGKQAPQATSSDQPVYTYVALWEVPRGDWPAAEKYYKDSTPTLNKLVSSGTLVAWGQARAWVHDSTGFTHMEWFTATSFGDIDATMRALRDVAPLPSAFAKGKHADEVLRSTIHAHKPGASGSAMLWIAEYAVKPDQMDDFTQLFDGQIRPLFDDQMGAGSILSYSLNFQAVHTGNPGRIAIAYMLPNAAAIDKFQAALAADETTHPELGPAILATMQYAEHRDSIFEVLAFGQK